MRSAARTLQIAPSRLLPVLYLVIVSLALLYLIPGLTARTWLFFLSRRIPIRGALFLGASAAAASTLVLQSAANNRIVAPSIMGLEALYVLIQSLILFVFGARSIFVSNEWLNFSVSLVGMMRTRSCW